MDINISMRIFYENFTYLISINRVGMTTTQGSHARFMKTLSFYSLSLVVKSIEEQIQLSSDYVDITRG